jgi:hypothetical protein
MSAPNFECHVTVLLNDPNVPIGTVRSLGAKVAKELHWSTSEIERDPVLGKDSYFYLTSHDVDLVRMMERMQKARDMARMCGLTIVREKIEVVIHDIRYDKPSVAKHESEAARTSHNGVQSQECGALQEG